MIAHDVVIVGGGQAGISVAAKLRRDGLRDVALIDPISVHRYRPLLSYVGGGQARTDQTEKPQRRVIPRGVRWYRQRVIALDPESRRLRTDQGVEIEAGDLVICPGVEPDWTSVPGSREAVFSAHGSSNYVDERAAHTWALIRGLRAGRAVFVVSDGVVPCAGVGLKPLFLGADHWRRAGVLSDIDITVVLGWDSIFGIPRIDRQLREAADRFGVTVLTGAQVTSVDAVNRTVAVSQRSDGPEPSRHELAYDVLHYVPTHRAPSWVAEAGLATTRAEPAPVAPAVPSIGSARASWPGMVDVDPETLAHRRHSRIWGLGDGADVQASRSGGALRKQAGVVAENLQRRRDGRELVRYNGYTTAPITVSRDQLVLAEYDREARLTPSVPFPDLTRARRLTWFYDRYLQPWLYWHSILKGRVRP